MKNFGRHLAALGLLSISLLLAGCQLDGDDIFPVKKVPVDIVVIPPTTGEVGQLLPLGGVESEEEYDLGPGHILAGQTGSRFVTYGPGGSSFHVSGDPGSIHTWDYILDSAAGARIQVSAGFSYSPGSSYSDAMVGGFGGLEIAGATVYDSVFHCEIWPQDSSTGTILQYNSLSNTGCIGGTRTFVQVDSRYKPHRFELGERIDASSTWGASSGVFNQASSVQQTSISPLGAYVYSTTSYIYRFWTDTDIHYVGFRWWSQNHYRYGYLKLAAGNSDAYIYEIVYEQ